MWLLNVLLLGFEIVFKISLKCRLRHLVVSEQHNSHNHPLKKPFQSVVFYFELFVNWNQNQRMS